MKSYRETLEPILRHAGSLALQLRREGLTTAVKPDGSVVSNADKAVSDFIIAALSAAYPTDGIVSEENPDLSGMQANRTWVIDPIDGTKHYVKDGQMFCIMVCLYDTDPLFSMVYYPVLGRWYWAEKGQGSYMKDRGKVRRLHVVPPHDPPRIMYGAECKHCIGEEGTKGIMKYFSKIMHGKLDCFLRSDVPYWDLCPPMLLLTEAGGVATDFSGTPVHYGHETPINPEIVAGHPLAVASALRVIQQRQGHQ
jgi:fructose-1,6-bisphosphatase/inositol monophosphatase family enzyme